MHSLIMMTAALRLQNIPDIANSIEYAYEFNKEYLKNIPLTWCICIDKYNADLTRLDDLVKYVKEKFDNRIVIIIIYSGKENQKNYGGDMFNGPMSFAVDNMKKLFGNDIHNWIYVLDDDNIVHPYLFRAFAKMTKNMPERYSMIWVAKIRHTGMIDSPYTKYVLDYAKKCDTLPSYLCPDPSQVMFDYDKIISKYGEMLGGSDYDYKWYVPVMIQELNDKNVVISNEFFYREKKSGEVVWCGDKTMATHNCLRDSSTLDIDNSDEVMYINISKDLLNESNTYFILNEETRYKIKELIKEDIAKYHH